MKKIFLITLLLIGMMLSTVSCSTSAGSSGDTTVDTTAGTTVDTTNDPVKDEYTYKYVVIVGVDGAGAFFKDAETPNLDEIFADGAVTYEAITSTPSISAQCWGSMLHGVLAEIHGLTNNIAGNQPYPSDSLFPSIFSVIREQMPDASLASFCNWNPINIGIIEEGIDVYKDSDTVDALVIEKAYTYVKDQVNGGSAAPTLLFIQLDEADGAGHSFGFGKDDQLKKITEQDALIRQLYDTYADLGLIEDTLFIVTADHGGFEQNHGGTTDTEMNIMVAAAGKTVENGTIGDMEVRDIAGIVAYALGLEQPESWTARVPSGLFEGVGAGERPEFVWPGNEFRVHESVPTPAEGEEGYISNFITDKKLTYYLPFDGDNSDKCGAEVLEDGKFYFVDGYFGKAVMLDDGYLRIPEYDPGTESFTVSMWMKLDGIDFVDYPLFSNQNVNVGISRGFAFWLNNGGIAKFDLFGKGGKRIDSESQLPAGFRSGWVHVMLVADRAAETVDVYYDFIKVGTLVLPDMLKGSAFDGYGYLNIGILSSDESIAYPSITLDEFMVFDGALTADEIAEFSKYYG